MKNLIFCFILLSTNLCAQSKSEAVQLAQATANQFMQKISPLSGYNSYATTKKITFTKSKGQYEITMSANWSGKPCILCDETTFILSGVLMVNRDGSNASFIETNRNEAVSSATKWNEIGYSGGRFILDQLVSSDKDVSFSKDFDKNKRSFIKTKAFAEMKLYSDTTLNSEIKGSIDKGNTYSYLSTKNRNWLFVFVDNKTIGYCNISNRR
jgi:hypothetical protein